MIMSALEELILRLPMTEGYIVDKHFLFIWLNNYLPQLILLFITCSTVALVDSIKTIKLYENLIKFMLLVIYIIILQYLLSPIVHTSINIIFGHISPPNPNNILHSPYNWQTNVIASVFFIEPMIGCFAITWIFWDIFPSYFILKTLYTIIMILILNNMLLKFIFFMHYTTLPLGSSLLSISQFTMQWIFAGIMISLLCHYLKRRCY